MPAERYYYDGSLQQGQNVELVDGEFHHLVHVMRAREGDEIELFNGKGALALVKVVKLKKDAAFLEISRVQIESPRQPVVILAQALPKPNRLDIILEKGTELGVDAFWLFPGKRSLKKDIFPNQLEKMHSQVKAAMKQCGRLFLPEIAIKPPLEDWEKIGSSAFFGDINPDAIMFKDLWEKQKQHWPIIFFVGPESGFDTEEEQQLKEIGAQGVKLNSNVLRTETAAISALALIEHWLMH